MSDSTFTVTANGKTVNYTSVDHADLWAEETTEDENVLLYMIINLQDIINNIENLTTEFTVKAYAKDANGITYVCENTNEGFIKTYSVATMVAEYKDLGYDVEHLYNYLSANGAFEEVA